MGSETIDVSSTTTRSWARGCARSWRNAVWFRRPSSRWSVVGSMARSASARPVSMRPATSRSSTCCSTASRMRAAALPVGAANATRTASPCSAARPRAAARIRATVWVLPVPGPPAIDRDRMDEGPARGEELEVGGAVRLRRPTPEHRRHQGVDPPVGARTGLGPRLPGPSGQLVGDLDLVVPVALQVETVAVQGQREEQVGVAGGRCPGGSDRDDRRGGQRGTPRPRLRERGGRRTTLVGPGRHHLVVGGAQVEGRVAETGRPGGEGQAEQDVVGHRPTRAPEHGGHQVDLVPADHPGLHPRVEHAGGGTDRPGRRGDGGGGHEPPSPERPSSSALAASRRPGANGHEYTPWGPPSPVGAAAPVIPRTNR